MAPHLSAKEPEAEEACFLKEELLKSPKDLEDARHLRIIYSEKLSEDKISEIKRLIRKFRLK